MNDATKRLLEHPSVDVRSPSPSGAFDRLAERLGTPLPRSLIQFWESSDGATLKGHRAEILSTSEVLNILNAEGFGDSLLDAGYLPVLYDHESNYVCATITLPMAPRGIYLLHDDSPQLLYRNIDSFIEGCLGLLATTDLAGTYFHVTHDDYGPDAFRSPDDIEAAKVAIQSGNDQGTSIAVQLLDANCKNEWRSLLNGDGFARQDARHRLKSMTSAAAKSMLQRDDDELAAFATEVCDAAERAGISFTRKSTVVRVASHWIDLSFFFGRRHINNAIPRLLDWIRDVRDGIAPTERPRHYMAD